MQLVSVHWSLGYVVSKHPLRLGRRVRAMDLRQAVSASLVGPDDCTVCCAFTAPTGARLSASAASSVWRDLDHALAKCGSQLNRACRCGAVPAGHEAV